MTTMVQNPEVRAYLDELQQALSGRPPAERDLVLDGVRQHIEDALGAGPADPEHVRRVLDDLGDPVAIAAESGADPLADTAARAPFLERRSGVVLISLLVAFGGFLAPVLGWLVGLFLLWRSSAWTRLDKVVGTAGPLVLALVLLGIAAALASTGLTLTHLAIVVGLVVGTIAAGAYLLIRARPVG